MRLSIERLRTALLVLAGVLVIAVAGFLGYARYRAHSILRDLPHKLGMQIQQSADGFTYSQSHGGHTLFTLHASKVIQYKDGGRATLHDVSILLYGADGNRADRISGQDFDYDPSTGIAQAQGEVQIDLQSPAKPARPATPGASANEPSNEKANGSANSIPNGASPAASAASANGGSIRVKTSGLVFNEKTGMATTERDVEFQFPQASGRATGASYDSQRGVLMLDHAVEINSSNDGTPLVLHSGHAQILRDSHRGFFDKVACTYHGDHVSAEHATLLFRDDGSAQQINADGSVHLQTDSGGVVDSKLGVLQMDTHNQPLKAELTSGVVFHSYDAVHKINGNAGEGVLTFGDKGAVRHATLSNLVSLVDLQTGLPGDAGGTATRQVQSGHLDIDLASGASGHIELTKVLAQGEARVMLRTNPTRGAKQDTSIAADALLANFADGSSITTLDGTGHTRLTDVAADGTTETSAGDTLAIKFAPAAAARIGTAAPLRSGVSGKPTVPGSTGGGRTGGATLASGRAQMGTAQIQSAVQQGNVSMEQSVAAAQPGGPSPAAPARSDSGAAAFRATAQKATYTASSQILHLEGSPRVTDGSLDLTAGALDYGRATGDATASGGVKATYIRKGPGAGAAAPPGGQQSGGQSGDQSRDQSPDRGVLGGPGPAHILANQATLVHASGDAIFRGQARLWQGTNSIAAPVIELSRAQQTLKARSDGAPAVVNAALLTSSSAARPPGMVRIRSQQLLYSDGERKAVFRGAVVAEDGTATIRSDDADVFLEAAPAGQATGAAQKSGASGSQVDHMVASGHVLLQQGGRKGSGDKLLYSAQSGNFVLTGTGAARPTLSDTARGTVTGDSLIFNSRDDSVTVSGGPSGTATQTRAPR